MTETALIISATSPVPVDNGKCVVMYGLVQYLADRLGPDNVHFALLANPGSPPPELPAVTHLLGCPSTASQLATLSWRLLADRSVTAQEALLGSSSLRKQVHALVGRLRPTIEVYDTLRMAQHAPTTPRGRRRVLYLDDLFSERYRRMVEVLGRGGLVMDPLGRFADFVPTPLRSLARRPYVCRAALRFERDRIRRRETEIVPWFDVNLLVNAREVRLLRQRSGVGTIETVAPLLPAAPAPARCPASPPELVFIGLLNVPHNDDAICAFLQTAMTKLENRCPGVRLRVIGKGASPKLLALARAHPDSVVLEGFVDDLDDALSRATAVLAPLRFGSGVKIKVLEALARGVPTVATAVAAEGIPLAVDGSDGCIVEDDIERWPALIDWLTSPGTQAAHSKAALSFFARNYSRSVVAAHYDRIFGLNSRPERSPARRVAG
jgi:glycosyltransferase involved in cell wall biosynthesis